MCYSQGDKGLVGEGSGSRSAGQHTRVDRAQPESNCMAQGIIEMPKPMLKAREGLFPNDKSVKKWDISTECQKREVHMVKTIHEVNKDDEFDNNEDIEILIYDEVAGDEDEIIYADSGRSLAIHKSLYTDARWKNRLQSNIEAQ